MRGLDTKQKCREVREGGVWDDERRAKCKPQSLLHTSILLAHNQLIAFVASDQSKNVGSDYVVLRQEY